MKPFIDPITNTFEIINEVFVLLVGYHMIGLTGFTVSLEMRYWLGISIMTHIVVLIIINYLRWIFGVFFAIKIRYKKYVSSRLAKKKMIEGIKQKFKITAEKSNTPDTGRGLMESKEVRIVEEEEKGQQRN